MSFFPSFCRILLRCLFICFSLHEEFVITCWEPFQASNSVTRWLDYIFNAWPFTPMKICPTKRKITKMGSKFCQILNEPSKNDPDTEFFAKSGHTARPQVAYSFWSSYFGKWNQFCYFCVMIIERQEKLARNAYWGY